MKKVIGIYTYYHGINEPFWDEYSENLGGSETWTIEIAKEFQKKGYHTIVFGHPQFWHFAPSGVEYVPREIFKARCEYQHFDYFISSRTAEELNAEIVCPNIYIMSHEAIINKANNYIDLKPNLFRKIGYLSEWHKDILKAQYDGLSENDFFKTFNGIDPLLYANVDENKKRNLMVWSSCKERGLKYFINAIFPCIKRFIPDFELAICSYNNNIPGEYKIMEGITILGKQTKQELADLQKQAKIWVYLNYGIDEETYFRCHETFCLTAVENAFAKNALICSNATGLASTLEGYSGYIGTNLDLSYFNMTREVRNLLKDEAIDKAITLLTNEEERLDLANEAFNICKKYTWENAADEWIEMFNKK